MTSVPHQLQAASRTSELSGGSGGSVTTGLAWDTWEGLQGSRLNPVHVPFIDLTERKHFPTPHKARPHPSAPGALQPQHQGA